MLKRIRADQVRLGMYVRRFHGNWLRHPFWRARFIVHTEKVLARIQDAGLDVSIDVDLGADVPADTKPQFGKAPMREPGKVTSLRPSPPPAPVFPLPSSQPPKRVVAPVAFGRADKVRALALAERSTSVVKALFADWQIGHAVPVGQIVSVVDDITCTLEQNGSAFLSVTRLKSKDNGTYVHSIAVCALMIGLARENGATAGEIQAYGTAGLLHDIGKVAIDDTLLHKTEPLTPDDIIAVRKHPQLGRDILAAEKGLPEAAIDVCLHHHERIDGSGYPESLKYKDLSLPVRMAMICDCYEAMTSQGRADGGLRPIDAIEELHGHPGYDDVLMFKFMRSIGVFPARMLVRLRSNRLAVVLPSAGEDRRPLARAFYSTGEGAFTHYEDVVMSDSLQHDQAIGEEDPGLWFPSAWPAMCAAILGGKPLTAAIVSGADAEEPAVRSLRR